LINSSGANKLTVSKKNINAINLYKKLGFEIISETPKIYFMEK
jgi:ribosomal protein S18 acetylase RimI-like enzyme